MDAEIIRAKFGDDYVADERTFVRGIDRRFTAHIADRVTFRLADILDEQVSESLPPVNAAILDSDWAITGPDHIHRFVHSSTKPPADALLARTFRATGNVALVLPPQLNVHEFDTLPTHESERLYLGDSHELHCLYFGELAVFAGQTEFRV